MHNNLTSTAAPRRTAHRGRSAQRAMPTFFALAFGLAWSFLIADALGHRGMIAFRLTLSGPGLILALLMSYAPTLTALFIIGITEGRAGLWSLLRAVTHWRVGLRWYALALGGPAVLFYVAARVSELLGGEPRPLPTQGWAVLLAGVVGSLVHGIANGEEAGWRGYALPQLLRRQRALSASLVLGAIWFVFHIPIMFVPNSIAGGQSFETALPFLISVLATSTLMTWVYRSTGGSVLLTILLHGAANAGRIWSEARRVRWRSPGCRQGCWCWLRVWWWRATGQILGRARPMMCSGTSRRSLSSMCYSGLHHRLLRPYDNCADDASIPAKRGS